jgi:hypothetical protein
MTFAEKMILRRAMQEFHIHLDAQWIAKDFQVFLLVNEGFSLKNFSGFPDNLMRHAPEVHLTRKMDNAHDFHQIFDTIQTYLENHSESMAGYVEGEYIPGEISIPNCEFNPDFPVPFVLELDELPSGLFREDEIHITLDRDKSDPRLLLALRQMGFFSVYMDKDWGVAEIFTTQGSFNHISKSVLPSIIDYLSKAGGAVNCVVKEERIVRSWMSSPDIKRPPVICKIHPSDSAVSLSNPSLSLV